MREPLQQRSADTLERVIESAERLLQRGDGDDLTIAQVVADSGVSVGAIYARFSDKEGVFSELVSRFMRSTLGAFDGLDRRRWQQLPLREALAEMVATNAGIYRQHRGVLRALSLRTRLARADHIRSALQQYNGQVQADLVDLLVLHNPAINHTDPIEAINVSIAAMTSMLRDAIVLGEAHAPHDRTERQVVDLLFRYLTARDGGS